MHSLQKGEYLSTVLYEAYMKSVSTGKSYSKRLCVLFQNFDWNKAAIVTHKSWRAFVDSANVL